MDGGLWHCTGGRDQDHAQGKEMQKCKMVVWRGLINSWEKRSKRQRRKQRYTHLNAEFQRTARRNKKAFLSDQLEKAMATHSSSLVWKIPWMEKPGRLQSMGSLGVGHNWATSPSLFIFMHWRRDGGAWWAAVYGVAQNQTQLKRLSSSSSSSGSRAPKGAGSAGNRSKLMSGRTHSRLIWNDQSPEW